MVAHTVMVNYFLYAFHLCKLCLTAAVNIDLIISPKPQVFSMYSGFLFSNNTHYNNKPRFDLESCDPSLR
jgi:hypothetical protein